MYVLEDFYADVNIYIYSYVKIGFACFFAQLIIIYIC